MMNTINNEQEYLVQKIRTQYTEKQHTELDELRALDRKVKMPANAFTYSFGRHGLAHDAGYCDRSCGNGHGDRQLSHLQGHPDRTPQKVCAADHCAQRPAHEGQRLRLTAKTAAAIRRCMIAAAAF